MSETRSQPYFFAFDTKSKPGVVIAHCVRFEALEIPIAKFGDDTVYTLLGADCEKPHIKQALQLAYTFVKRNGLEPKG